VRRFVARRIGQAVITVLVVTIIMFVLLHLLPGGPARAILGPRATALQIRDFNHSNGFDRPLAVQYLRYIYHALHGDLGFSYQLNQSVLSLLGQRMPKTLLLTALSLVGAVLVGIPVGVVQAVRRNKFLDHLLTGASFILYGTPIFLLGLLLVAVFGVYLHLLPAQAPQTGNVLSLLENWRGMVLPVLTLSGVTLATFTRYTRSASIEVLGSDYIRTAYAKGATSRRVVMRHVLRNACLPVITILGLYLPALFSGALVVEYLFNFPGMGLLLWNAAQSRDYPVLIGVALVVSVATVVGSLIVDVSYAVLDPRIRLRAAS
jgi:peptide/nickel transport system permease protein